MSPTIASLAAALAAHGLPCTVDRRGHLTGGCPVCGTGTDRLTARVRAERLVVHCRRCADQAVLWRALFPAAAPAPRTETPACPACGLAVTVRAGPAVTGARTNSRGETYPRAPWLRLACTCGASYTALLEALGGGLWAFPYRDGDRTLHTYRLQRPDGGKQVWSDAGLSGRRSLAILPGRAADTVLHMLEGEKAALAGMDRLASPVAAYGASGNAETVDLEPMAPHLADGGMVLLWPDADEAGHGAAMTLYRRIAARWPDAWVRVVVWPAEADTGRDLADCPQSEIDRLQGAAVSAADLWSPAALARQALQGEHPEFGGFGLADLWDCFPAWCRDRYAWEADRSRWLERLPTHWAPCPEEAILDTWAVAYRAVVWDTLWAWHGEQAAHMRHLPDDPEAAKIWERVEAAVARSAKLHASTQWQSSATRKTVLAQMRVHNHMSIPEPSPDLWNLPSGVLDMRTGEVRPRGPEDLYDYCMAHDTAQATDRGREIWAESREPYMCTNTDCHRTRTRRPSEIWRNSLIRLRRGWRPTDRSM